MLIKGSDVNARVGPLVEKIIRAVCVAVVKLRLAPVSVALQVKLWIARSSLHHRHTKVSLDYPTPQLVELHKTDSDRQAGTNWIEALHRLSS